MKVLLVDDDPDIRMIASLALRQVGKWQVDIAESGTEALQIVASLQPDLILLDLMMPGLDGLGTLRALRQQPELAHIPVIFLTAKVQSGDIARYRQAGAAGCIQKPFDPLRLAVDVQRVLAEQSTP